MTTADTDMKFSWMRQEIGPVRPDYNPDELDEAWISAANIWFIRAEARLEGNGILPSGYEDEIYSNPIYFKIKK